MHTTRNETDTRRDAAAADRGGGRGARAPSWIGAVGTSAAPTDPPPVSPLSKGAAFSKRINLARSPATALRGRSVKVDEGAVRLGGIPHPLVLLRAPALACARVTRVGRGSASPARRRAIRSPGQGSGRAGPSQRPAPWALTFADEHGDLPRHGSRTLRPCRPARGNPPGFPVHRSARLTPALVGGARVAAARALTRARPPRHAGAHACPPRGRPPAREPHRA